MEWQLSDEELHKALKWKPPKQVTVEDYRAIADAAGKKGYEVGQRDKEIALASQCREKPCERCDLNNDCGEALNPGWCAEPTYCRWVGQQQGYAKGIQRLEEEKAKASRDMATKIVELICSWKAKTVPVMVGEGVTELGFGIVGAELVAQRLSEWLKEQEGCHGSC